MVEASAVAMGTSQMIARALQVALIAAAGISPIGCAQQPTTLLTDERVAQHNQDVARAKKTEADQRERLINSLKPTRDALAEFETEKRRSCASAHLKSARANALGAALAASPTAVYAYGLEGMIEAGGVVLDVADAARRARCGKIARELYDTVIATFVGSGYAALRQRAEIGINDLRSLPARPQ
jgi:hypothetical protein